MNNWLILITCLMGGAFIGSYTIFIYGFNHFESVVAAMITMLFIYTMLRLNNLERKLDVSVLNSAPMEDLE